MIDTRRSFLVLFVGFILIIVSAVMFFHEDPRDVEIREGIIIDSSDPTCNTDGYVTYQSGDDTYTAILPKTGDHQYGEQNIDNTGSYHACVYCGYREYEYRYVPSDNGYTYALYGDFIDGTLTAELSVTVHEGVEKNCLRMDLASDHYDKFGYHWVILKKGIDGDGSYVGDITKSEPVLYMFVHEVPGHYQIYVLDITDTRFIAMGEVIISEAV